MRFIVDFYRYVTFALIALLIVGLVFVSLVLADTNAFSNGVPPEVILIGIGVISLLVMSLGGIATFISIHDRHIELVAEVARIRAHFEEREDA